MPRWPKKEDVQVEKRGLNITEVRYERVFQVPNSRFGTERISLVASITDNRPINHVIQELRLIVMKNSVEGKQMMEKAKETLRDKDNHTFKEVSWAQAYLGTLEGVE